MSKINVGRYSETLRRLLNQAEADVTSELAPEISAVLVLESERPAWAFLANIRARSFGATVAANAGFISQILFQNKSTSGALVEIERIRVASTAGIEVFIGTLAEVADLGTVLNGGSLDTRWSLTAGSSVVISQSNAAAAVAYTRQLDVVRLSVNGSVDAVSPIVLTPGFALAIQGGIVNAQLGVHMRWYERNLSKYEGQLSA